MSDEAMWSEWDLVGLAMEEAEEPYKEQDDSVLHKGPDFDRDTDFTEGDLS